MFNSHFFFFYCGKHFLFFAHFSFWIILLFFGLSVMSHSATPWTAAHPVSLSFTISWSLLKLMSVESVMASKHFVLCGPLLLLPSIFPTTRVFSNESALHIRWPKYWSFSISPSNEYSALFSFSMDLFDLPVQGTVKNLLQHHSSKVSLNKVSTGMDLKRSTN